MAKLNSNVCGCIRCGYRFIPSTHSSFSCPSCGKVNSEKNLIEKILSEPMPAPSSSPLDTQVGGDHYKNMKIQPIEYILANGIGFCEGAVIKYVSRWKAKGGIQDLKKARHFIDVLISNEEKVK